MDKLVRRVTVVQSSGEHRDAKVVYENDEDEDTDDEGPGTPTSSGSNVASGIC
jgi:hypothetical protein